MLKPTINRNQAKSMLKNILEIKGLSKNDIKDVLDYFDYLEHKKITEGAND